MKIISDPTLKFTKAISDINSGDIGYGRDLNPSV